MILIFKPFKVGDFIEAQGTQSGSVKEIQLLNTVINTPDNKTILIPNGSISTGIINNYSKEATRRLDWTFGIAYGDDYDRAKRTILEMLEADPRVLKSPAPFVAQQSGRQLGQYPRPGTGLLSGRLLGPFLRYERAGVQAFRRGRSQHSVPSTGRAPEGRNQARKNRSERNNAPVKMRKKDGFDHPFCVSNYILTRTGSGFSATPASRREALRRKRFQDKSLSGAWPAVADRDRRT